MNAVAPDGGSSVPAVARWKALVREPLVHFLAIGAGLFLLSWWAGGGSGPTSNRIVLTAGQVEHLAANFARTWQRPPSAAELKGLADDWVREEIAVREAMAAGLDRDDTVIRRRLRQKLEFLLEDASAAAPPSDAQLEAWLRAHPEKFRVEPRETLRQVLLSRERRGARAEAEALPLLAELQAAGPEAGIADLGDPSLLPQEIEFAPRSEIERQFGSEFVEQVARLAPGKWSGPVESGFGVHLVLVRERVAGALPALAEVRPVVERELVAERRQRELAATYARLLENYRVAIEHPLDAAGASPTGPGRR